MRVVKPQISHCLALLSVLAEAGRGMRLTDLAAALGEPKSSVQRLLGHLIDEQWVSQDADTGHYRLTLRLATLGQRHLSAIGITDACEAILHRLARSTGELVRMTLVDGDRLVWIASAQGAAPGLMYQPEMGHHIVSFATANGKAWLATLAETDAARIARADGLGDARQRVGLGPKAVRSLGALLKDLAIVRKRGYGLAEEEAERGVTAIAVAIMRPSSRRAMGTVSVAGPSVRMLAEKLALIADALRQASGELAAAWPGGESASHLRARRSSHG